MTDRLRGTYFAKIYKALIGSSPDLGKSEFVLNWIVLASLGIALSKLASLGIALSIYAPTFHAKDDEKLNEALPVNAASFVLANGISGNLFDTYHYGGYLLYRFWPDR